MNRQLTKKGKQSKRAEAPRRAILWSEKELRKRQLNHTQQGVEAISLPNTTSVSITPDTETILKKSSKTNKDTISSLQQTIKDLKIQRQELDITIKVLSKHLEHLNQHVSKPSKRSKLDEY